MNNEQNNNTQPNPPYPTQPPVKQSNSKRNVLIVFVAVLFAAAVGAGVWYWQQQTIDEQSARLNSQSEQAGTIDEVDQQESTDAEQVDKADTQTEYEAEVGKFSLALPDKHKVVQKNDGGGEGGPSTRISIVDETDNPGVYTSSLGEEIIIFARPLDPPHLTFRGSVDGRVSNESVMEESTTTVDGVEAEVYVLGGLGNYQRIFFSNDGIFYSIEVSSESDDANEKLDTVIDSFSFN